LFNAIVIDGALQNNGMVSFSEFLDEEDTQALRAYVVSLANDLKENPPPAFGRPPAPAPAPEPEQAEEDAELHE